MAVGGKWLSRIGYCQTCLFFPKGIAKWSNSNLASGGSGFNLWYHRKRKDFNLSPIPGPGRTICHFTEWNDSVLNLAG